MSIIEPAHDIHARTCARDTPKLQKSQCRKTSNFSVLFLCIMNKNGNILGHATVTLPSRYGNAMVTLPRRYFGFCLPVFCFLVILSVAMTTDASAPTITATNAHAPGEKLPNFISPASRIFVSITR